MNKVQSMQSKIISNLEVEIDSMKQKEISINIIISNSDPGNIDSNQLMSKIIEVLQSRCSLNDIESINCN